MLKRTSRRNRSSLGGDCSSSPAIILQWLKRYERHAAATPDVIIFSPCGYNLAEAVVEGRTLLSIPAVAAVDWLYAVDADAFFVRPGPRVVDGIETIFDLLHGNPDRDSGPGWVRLH